jgi:hypothetical protein
MNYVDTTSTWSLHQRVYFPTGASHAVWTSAGGGKGTWIIMYIGKVYIVNANNLAYGAGDGGYRCPGVAGGAASDWYTLSLVCSATGAGGVKVFVNGSQTGTISWETATEQSSPSTTCEIGDASLVSGVGTTNGVKTRAFAACNVAHSDAEVAAIHSYFASLAA